MKYAILITVVTGLAAVLVWSNFQPKVSPKSPSYSADPAKVDDNPDVIDTQNTSKTEVIAENLTIPWEIVFLPDGELLVTERSGNVVLLKQGVIIPISGVEHIGEGGLLGAALHPDFNINNFVYLYQTTETPLGLINRINRYTLTNNKLVLESNIVDDLPGARFHDGGRIAFGPGGYLYVTLGDAGNENAAQDTNSLAGSILRYTAEGKIPDDNPFNSAIYSYGHRNPQGLAWDSEGDLWSSEHGRSGIRSGFDEINLIIPGNNYGWPVVEGDESQPGFESPIRHSGADITWAPGGLAYLDGALYMPGLRSQTLYKATIEENEIVAWDEYFVGEYGRLRTVTVGPDDLLYLTTSNRDGRGSPAENDDRIIRVNPALLE